jgi:uncharacterized protein HemY
MIYAFGPAEIRDPQQALAYANQAIQKHDSHWGFQTTRGVCLYRAGNYQEAADVLQAAFQKEGRNHMNRCFAAMSYQQLGEVDKAKQCYAEALKLASQQNRFGQLDLLKLVREEAEAVLNTSKEE